MDQTKIFELSSRARQTQDKSLNEAMTKTSLVMPFIQSLGYDVFDPSEVVAEFTSDVGTKKGEKVDFAIMRDGEPVIIIECKALGYPLDAGKCNQLLRYFPSHLTVKIGILTDGAKYMFFSDLEQPNIMDTKPFMVIDLNNFNERHLPDLQKLSKERWDIESALSSANSLKYINEVKKVFSEEVSSPSDAFIRYFATRVYNGHLTAKVREQFSSIVKRAIQEFVNDQINMRLESAKVDERDESAGSQQDDLESGAHDGIETTDDEVISFLVVQTILRRTVSPDRIFIRDAKSYCSIILDDNNRKPICRFYFNGKKKYVVIFGKDKKEEKFMVDSVDDLYEFTEKFIESAQQYLDA